MNNTGVCGALEVADPLDACIPLRNEFGSNKTDPIRFALIIRGDCSFEEKIRNTQSGGFSAAIVYDDKDGGNLVYSKLIFSIIFHSKDLNWNKVLENFRKL